MNDIITNLNGLIYLNNFIGVIGSGLYKNKSIVYKILSKNINKKTDIIVSGKSPRNKFNNVDIWGEEWGIKYCKNKPIIYPPNTILLQLQNKSFNKMLFYNIPINEFKKRNKQIAIKSNELICFINKGQYISGTWNTIKFFCNKNDFNIKKIKIYNEYGNLWNINEYPFFLKKNVKKKM